MSFTFPIAILNGTAFSQGEMLFDLAEASPVKN